MKLKEKLVFFFLKQLTRFAFVSKLIYDSNLMGAIEKLYFSFNTRSYLFENKVQYAVIDNKMSIYVT